MRDPATLSQKQLKLVQLHLPQKRRAVFPWRFRWQILFEVWSTPGIDIRQGKMKWTMLQCGKSCYCFSNQVSIFGTAEPMRTLHWLQKMKWRWDVRECEKYFRSQLREKHLYWIVFVFQMLKMIQVWGPKELCSPEIRTNKERDQDSLVVRKSQQS